MTRMSSAFPTITPIRSFTGFSVGIRLTSSSSDGFPENDVDCVWRRLSATHWKRELPTVAMLSSTAIGEFYLRPVDY